ncbi:MAG: MFS transporter [Planctomycetaceae bacterium]|nr:MFS transporter [Planctomycetaceae bacterium]
MSRNFTFKIKHLRWWIVSLLFLATVINYLSRQTLSILQPIIQQEFSLTNTHYSYIVFAFMLAYMFMQTGFGRIVDLLGTRIGMALAIAWWSAASLLSAFITSFAQLAICRFLLGAGEAGNWPGSVKAISEWFPVKERAFATGIFNSGSCIGALLAPPLIVWISVQWNWRMAFVATGMLGFIWLLGWLLLYRLPQHHPYITHEELTYIQGDKVSTEPVQNERSCRWRDLLKDRNTLSLAFARMFADPVWWFYVFWLPAYFKAERDFSIEMIGLFVWIPFLTADIGNFVGGISSSYLVKSGMPAVDARKKVMLASAIAMLAGIPAVLADSATMTLVFISIATLAYSSWATNILTLPADVFKPNAVASTSGLSGTGGSIGGMAFTLLTGPIVDRFSYTPVFVMAGIMPLVAVTIIMLGIKYRPALSACGPNERQGGSDV